MDKTHKLFHWLPFDDADYQKLAQHLVASLLIAIGTVFTTHADFKASMGMWLGASLIYSGGFLQKGSKPEVVLVNTETKDVTS